MYLIGLMGTEIEHSTSETWENRYISEYTFMEKISHELQDETIIIIFAELARFDKPLEMCETDLEKMLYIIRNSGSLDNQPEALRQKIFTRIFEACEIARFDEEKRIQYDKDMYDERRHNGELLAAENIGRKAGREEGREEARLADATKFKQLGVSVEIIAQATGLPIETIEKL